MFSSDDIKKDNTFKNFIKNKKLAESSKNIYAYRLMDFSNFIAKSPSEIIETYKSEYFENNLFSYINSLKDEGKSEITIQNNLETLRAFYNQYDINIPSNKHFNENINLIVEQVLNKFHIKQALNVTDKRDRAIILLQFTAGISPKILRNLTYGDFMKAIDEYINIEENDYLNINKIVNNLSNKQELIGKWLITKKTGDIFYTFNSTESTLAILDYLMFREITDKPIKILEDPLFVNKYNLKLKKSTYDGIFTRINKKAHFKHLKSNRRFFTSTNLKKSFKEALLRSGADKTIVNAISGLKSNINWDKDVVENFKIIYKRNSELLIIEEDNDVENLKTKLEITNVELNELKSQIRYLQDLVRRETE